MSHAALVLALRQAILSLPDPKVALYFMYPTKALTPPTIKHGIPVEPIMQTTLGDGSACSGIRGRCQVDIRS